MTTLYGPTMTLKQALRLTAAKRRLILKYCKRHGLPVVTGKPVTTRLQDYKGLPRLRSTR